MPAIGLQSLDFLFVLAFILGLYSLHRLLAVKAAKCQKAKFGPNSPMDLEKRCATFPTSPACEICLSCPTASYYGVSANAVLGGASP